MRAQLRNQNVGDFDLDEVSGALTERVKTGRQSQVVDELGLADFAGIGQPRAHGGVGRSAREADGAWTAKGVRVRSYPMWGS